MSIGSSGLKEKARKKSLSNTEVRLVENTCQSRAHRLDLPIAAEFPRHTGAKDKRT